MNNLYLDKDGKYTAIPDPVFDLAKEIFLKRAPSEFINEKSEAGYKAQAENAIKVAKFFIEVYEKTNNCGQ